MSLVSIILVLVLVGVLLGLINRYIPMAGSIKKILNIVVVVCVVYWILSIFGLVTPIENFFHGAVNTVNGSVNSEIVHGSK